MWKRCIFLTGVVLSLSLAFAAQGKYSDPDSPAVEAAARQALASAKILDIIGITRDIEAITRDIDATLKDLRAKVTDQEIRIELSADVLFDFDKYDLRPDAFESLRKVGEVLKSYAQSAILIEGHTDSKGSHPYNVKLSENRAMSVKNWLVKNAGADPAHISTKGWAETKPVAPNTNPDGSDNPDGRQKNRRVEIVVKKS
jgi:outer membrane protein OmpA-like peptidoglycan-associated protein